MQNNKTLSASIYAAVWLALVLIQTFVMSAQQGVPSVVQVPKLYYSTWCVDLYLIVLFYANYYGFAPKLFRRRLFTPYVWVVLVAVMLGVLIPIALYVLWGWTTPTTPAGQMPLSSLGALGAVAVISLSLAVRSILEWIHLDRGVVAQREREQALEAELALAKAEHARLTNELDALRHAQASSPRLEPPTTEAGL